MDISSMFNKLLDTGINSKNYFIVIPMIMCAILYILGVDINVIYNFSFTNTILLLSLFIYEFIIGCLFISKIDNIIGNNNNDNILETIAKLTNDNDILKSKMDDINTNIANHDKRFITATADLTNKPNINTIKLLINAYIKNMLNDIFEECLNYTLIVNDNNTDVVLSNLKDDIGRTVKKQTNSIHDILKSFDMNETMTDIINKKIDKMIDIIINDIQKNKKIEEKLYIINNILRETRKDIKKDISNYVRDLQIKFFE